MLLVKQKENLPALRSVFVAIKFFSGRGSRGLFLPLSHPSMWNKFNIFFEGHEFLEKK